MSWKLTVRIGPKVERSRHDEMRAGVDAAEARAREIAANVPKRAIDTKIRRFDPIQQVSARLELAGPERLVPSVRAGLDVRGDGSVEAYLGRVKREVIKQRKGENAYKALRRAMTEKAGTQKKPAGAKGKG